MSTGALVVLAAFGAGGASLAGWLLAWSGHAAARRMARALHHAMTAALALASVLLMAAILTDDFSVRYVSDYSSRELPLVYKISAFWGGQEGTLLLWALLQAAAGGWLLRRRDEAEPAVMTFLLVPQIFLLLCIVTLDPFKGIPPPPDGAGLNPLLLDPWMAIHPPIVFLGYAVLVVPFALALAALVRGKPDAWVPAAMPWVLVSMLTLGAGLFIGAFWAYKVLGWGGYWGWDPVENSSLAPWLVAAALIHGLLTQRVTGALRRTNLALAAASYVLVLYATFMTRSGVLSDFSVHSFTDRGINAQLIAAIIVTTALPTALLAWRWRRLGAADLKPSLALPSVLALAMLLLLAGTALLVVGTSWPILSGLLGKPASPGPGFYNRTSLPIGIGIGALLVAAPLMAWAPSSWRDLLRKVAPGLAAGIAAAGLTAALAPAPKGGFLVLVLLAAAVGALVASLTRVARQIRANPMASGAGVAHAGLALMFIGIITTSAFDRSEGVTLAAGQPGRALGHELMFQRYVPGRGDESHFEIDVVPASGPAYAATPVMFRDERRDTVVARPHIRRRLLGDVYVAPVSHRPAEGPEKEIVLAKDKPLEWGPLSLTFRRFEAHSAEGASMSVGALVDVARDGRTEPVTLTLSMAEGGVEKPTVPLPLGDGATGRLDGMQVERGLIRVTVSNPSAAPTLATLAVEVSDKPLVNALWLGILLVSVGSALAAAFRAREEKVLAALGHPAPAAKPGARLVGPPALARNGGRTAAP